MQPSSSQVLIVPLWNWNYKALSVVNLLNLVLIVPLWNWNVGVVHVVVIKKSFNRTFMELKFPIISNLSIVISFNRTFMELK